MLTAGAPLDHAAQRTLAATEQAARQSGRDSSTSAAGAVEARRRAAAAAAELPALTRRVAASRRKLEIAQAKLAQAERAQARRRASIAEHQQGAARLLAGLQTMSRRPPLAALAQPGSAADIAHTRMALDAVMPEVRARTGALRAKLAAAEPARRRLQAARDVDASLTLTLARDQAALARAETVARRGAVTLAERAVIERAAAERYAVDVVSLRELVDRVAPARGAAPAVLRLRAPVPGVAEVIESDPLFPQSLSFTPPAGEPVVAPSAGRVAFAGDFGSYGGVVILDHGGGWRSILSGFGAVAVRTGTIVPTGTMLGRAGAAQLRYGLRRANQAVDPLPFLPPDMATVCRDDGSFAHRSGRAKAAQSNRTVPCRVKS